MNSEKKLKLIISSLKDKQLIKLFQSYINSFSTNFNKSIKQISFNCFESVCEFRSKVVNGYGKNSNEAFVNGIRNLIDLLLQQEKNQIIMKQCLKKINGNFQSQKKLLATDKTFKHQSSKIQKTPLAMSTSFNYTNNKKQKQKSIKQQIFQYANLQHLKISNPNAINKNTHEKYLSNSINEQQQEQQLKLTLKKIAQIQLEISQANIQNQKLKEKLNKLYQKDKENKQPVVKNNNFVLESSCNNNNSKNSVIYSEQDNNSNMRMRSISVDPSQKYYIPHKINQSTIEQSTKHKIPKLNLQMLPNYHGKSNKSLNQSLLQVYQKNRK